jgi:multidrug efflux pump
MNTAMYIRRSTCSPPTACRWRNSRRAEDIRQRLLRVADVNKVDLIGEQPQKIFIELSHQKLATLGIAPQQIFDSVAKQNAVASGGSVDTSADRINLRVTGAFSGVDAIAAVPVQVDTRVFRLGDIASVKRDYQDPPAFLVREGGKPALGLGVSMQDGANILSLGENLKAAMAAIVAELPVGIEVTQIADQPRIVEQSVSEFVETFIEALGIVLLVSFLSLGWRAGIVVALSVPLVLAIVLTIMYAAGIDLHRITLGALIIALGLLVDDAIIAIEMMVVKMEQGWDRARAATFAWTSTAFPMLTGTLVTAAGFLPVGFAKSSAGEYAGGIFWIVSLALLASWIVAVVFTPYLGFKLLPDMAKPAAREDADAIYDTRIYRALRGVIELALRWRGTVVAVTAVMFVAGSRALGLSNSSSSRPRPAASCSSRCDCPKAAPSAPPTRQPRRPSACLPAIPTSSPTPPMSARARRASGWGSTRSSPMPTSPRSSS